MTKWALIEDGTETVLVPQGIAPAWDVAVDRAWPGPVTARARRRIARQVRQDVWRAARGVRGFVPVIRVAGEDMLEIRAGGRLLAGGNAPERLTGAITAIVDDTKNRRRWMGHARRGQS